MKSNVIGWSDAKFKGWIVALLRRGSIRYPPRNEALKEAKTEKKINPASGRLAQHYVCAGCGDEFPMSAVQVNHKEPVIGEEGFISWDKYIERMFCAKENFEVLCKSCHEVVTQKEASRRREFKTSSERKDVHEIDEDTKEEILARYFEGGISQSKLAKEYGVSQGVISKWVVQIKEENKYDYKN